MEASYIRLFMYPGKFTRGRRDCIGWEKLPLCQQGNRDLGPPMRFLAPPEIVHIKLIREK